jgi:3-hydroxybutyryl-CoA dehydrogenase
MIDKNMKILVAGAGTMGNSIAQGFATAGFKATMYSRTQKTLDGAKAQIEASLKTCDAANLLGGQKIADIMARLSYTTSLEEGAKGAGFVLETVAENPDVKKDIFAQLEKIVAPDAIIASNASFLNVFNIAELKHMDRLVVAHYYAPAHIIPLVEVVPGPQTSEATMAKTVEIMQAVGKAPVRMKKFGVGFIVNRIQKAIGETCMDMIQEGLVEPTDIDQAVKNTLGIRLPIVGVIQTFDFQGLDNLYSIQQNAKKIYSFVEDRVKAGEYGVKTAKGLYDYQGRTPAEILEKRDELYIKMYEFLKSIKAFEPV